MANCNQTYPAFNYGSFKIDRGQILTEKDLEGKHYLRFKFTESGVSPRVPLGTKGTTLWYTGDEHNEEGHISEEPFNRIAMMEKRMKKLDLALKEIPLEDKVAFFGDADAEKLWEVGVA
jgi:2-oxoglutarate ferredoxin oxidoreductase subunit alpha